MTQYLSTAELYGMTCANCGILFAVPDHYDDKRREDHRTFYCPNGHTNYYPGETDVERLEKQLIHVRDQRDAAERSLRATKGVVTKMKKRAANGVCPCCNRHFANLQRHMETKHPEFQS